MAAKLDSAALSSATRPLPPTAATAASSTRADCRCRIQGTVEVEWDRPLQGRTPVTIYLDDHPDVQDTVELFMGSPRAFELKDVPCGPHRLLFKTHSKQRFALVSNEPRVDCTAGGYHQTRIVIQPLQGRRLVP
jgi:hypothetical protein